MDVQVAPALSMDDRGSNDAVATALALTKNATTRRELRSSAELFPALLKIAALLFLPLGKYLYSKGSETDLETPPEPNQTMSSD